MALHIHRVDIQQHDAFLAENRKDPATLEEFRPRDEIVICARCKSAWLKDSWEFNGRQCSCDCMDTLPNIPRTQGEEEWGNVLGGHCKRAHCILSGWPIVPAR